MHVEAKGKGFKPVGCEDEDGVLPEDYAGGAVRQMQVRPGAGRGGTAYASLLRETLDCFVDGYCVEF